MSFLLKMQIENSFTENQAETNCPHWRNRRADDIIEISSDFERVVRIEATFQGSTVKKTSYLVMTTKRKINSPKKNIFFLASWNPFPLVGALSFNQI